MQTKEPNQFTCIAGKEIWNVNTGLTVKILALRRRLLTTCHQGTQDRSERSFMNILNILSSNGVNSNGGASNEKAS